MFEGLGLRRLRHAPQQKRGSLGCSYPLVRDCLMTPNSHPSDQSPPRPGSNPPHHFPRGFRVVAIFQLWGAATGTWAVLRTLPSDLHAPRSVSVLAVQALILAFFTLSGAGALFLLRGRQAGIRMVALAQVPQLFYLQMPQFQYMLLSGIYVVVYSQGSFLGISNGVASTYVVQWAQQGLEWGFGLNLVAVGILVYLRRRARGGTLSAEFSNESSAATSVVIDKRNRH
jgi:hypothetical protein